jgi:hypothetical protein
MGQTQEDDSTDARVETRKEATDYLKRNDVELPPDELTMTMIHSRSANWEIGGDEFRFEVERHPTPLTTMTSGPGKPMRTAARWHKLKQYSYSIPENEWEIDVVRSDFRFDPQLIIEREFGPPAPEEMWQTKIDRINNADNPEDVLDEEFAPVEEGYREQMHKVPEEKIDGIIDCLRQELRTRTNQLMNG